jgi:Domain of unknown function (DUF4407)
MKYLNRFFWWCAGANIHVLEDCPTDQAKFFGVGGTIVFTALMASFAGGYAFFTAFKSVPLSIFFGVFWGLLIFNLDRYIVSTIGKGDGTQKITLEEWKMAAPRLMMAILLGIVISTPLELKIFEKEIKTVVEKLKVEKAQGLMSADSSLVKNIDELKTKQRQLQTNIDNYNLNKRNLALGAGAYYEDRIQNLQNDYQEKNKEVEAIQKRVNILYNSYRRAINDSLSNTTISYRKNLMNQRAALRNRVRTERDDIGKALKELSENKDNAVIDERNRIQKQLDGYISEKDKVSNKLEVKEAELEAKKKVILAVMENYNGFAAHLDAMGELTKAQINPITGESKLPVMFYAKWLITVLFIFIEIAPVLFKLMTEAGPYDDIIDRIKLESQRIEEKKISDIKDDIDTSIKLSTQKNQIRLEAELLGNKALLEKIALAQAEVAEMAVNKWKEDELKKLELGVNHIINKEDKSNSI